jgi:copper chaperone
MELEPQEKSMRRAVLVLLTLTAGLLALVTFKMAISSLWYNFVTARAEATTVSRVVDLEVTGMTCGGCSSRITKALESLPGVEEAVVSHESGHAEVRVADDGPNPQQLIGTIEQQGYQATLTAGP